MLDILDYTKQELISDADFWQFAGEHLENRLNLGAFHLFLQLSLLRSNYYRVMIRSL